MAADGDMPFFGTGLEHDEGRVWQRLQCWLPCAVVVEAIFSYGRGSTLEAEWTHEPGLIRPLSSRGTILSSAMPGYDEHLDYGDRQVRTGFEIFLSSSPSSDFVYLSGGYSHH